jgi:hypothetical protein
VPPPHASVTWIARIRKRLDVAWKLESVSSAFDLEVLPGLLESRGRPQETVTARRSQHHNASELVIAG